MAFEKGSSSHGKVIVPETQKLKNNLKALVVDDNVVHRKIMKALLNNLDVENQEACNGKEAVELYQAGANFDIILMDNEMPIMDGTKATRILRSMGVRTKIIGVSGNSRANEIQEFMDAGLDEFYAKPMTRANLVSILEEISNV